MSDHGDIREFPEGHAGRKTYVPAVGVKGLVAFCFVYRGGDGRYHVHPDFGGTWDGLAARSDNMKVPYLMKDIGAYKSPIDGQVITTRSQHREHLKTHDVYEVGNEPIGKLAPVQAPKRSADIIERVKHHLDVVKAMPQKQYNEQVKTKAEALSHGD